MKILVRALEDCLEDNHFREAGALFEMEVEDLRDLPPYVALPGGPLPAPSARTMSLAELAERPYDSSGRMRAKVTDVAPVKFIP
jgi:hypothetical protein